MIWFSMSRKEKITIIVTVVFVIVLFLPYIIFPDFFPALNRQAVSSLGPDWTCRVSRGAIPDFCIKKPISDKNEP